MYLQHLTRLIMHIDAVQVSETGVQYQPMLRPKNRRQIHLKIGILTDSISPIYLRSTIEHDKDKKVKYNAENGHSILNRRVYNL